MLTTDIWDHSNHDDNEFNNQKGDDKCSNQYDDEEDDFGMEYLFVISELQVKREAK